MAKQCQKPKHKNQPCCKNAGGDVEDDTFDRGEGSSTVCQEKPKNVQKCNKKMGKWTRNGKVEKECNKMIGKYEKKQNKKGKNRKMKKCLCTCLKWKEGKLH